MRGAERLTLTVNWIGAACCACEACSEGNGLSVLASRPWTGERETGPVAARGAETTP